MPNELSLEQQKDLISRAKTDLAYFKDLYEYYFPKIYRYLYYRTNNQDDTQDLTSQVFLQAIKNFENYNFQGVSFGAWLYRIAHNLLVNHYKKPSPLYLSADKDMPDQKSFEEINQKLDFQTLHRLVSQLSPEAQQIIALRLSEGLSNQEIASVVGTTEAAVKMIFYRSIKKLQTYIK